MFCVAILLLAFGFASPDPISTAIENYEKIESYSVTLRSRKNSSVDEEIRYYYKRPGYVRMEFITPHKGAVLVYNPLTKKVKLRPFDFLKFFVLTLDPDESLISSSRGHTVDESDIGSLLQAVKKLGSNGKTETVREEVVGGKTVLIVSVEGEGDFTVEKGIHEYHLWLDKKTFLPLRAIAYDLQGRLLEEVMMDDLIINIKLSVDFINDI
jgi:outer membrane lipoprotein-sorting protein